MKILYGMFLEKDGTGAGEVSMTRVVSFMFALTVCSVLLILGWIGEQFQWPMAFLGVCTLFAVPFHALFKGRSGASLLKTFLQRFGEGQVWQPPQRPPQEPSVWTDDERGET
jgi:hypothetical protein